MTKRSLAEIWRLLADLSSFAVFWNSVEVSDASSGSCLIRTKSLASRSSCVSCFTTSRFLELSFLILLEMPAMAWSRFMFRSGSTWGSLSGFILGAQNKHVCIWWKFSMDDFLWENWPKAIAIKIWDFRKFDRKYKQTNKSEGKKQFQNCCN